MFSPMKTLYTYFPLTFFLRVLFLVLVFVAAIILVRRLYKKNKLNKRTSVITVLLVFYILMVLFYTVLGRRTREGYYYLSFDGVAPYLQLFIKADMEKLLEILLNIFMFVPIGIAIYFIAERRRVLYAGITGVSLSLLIEISQFILQNGYSELTDLIHNTLGALLGALFALMAVSIYKTRKRK